MRQNRRGLFGLLFAAASQTLLDHYHLHCIVTGGGVSLDGSRWVASPAHYLFAVHALSRMYRGKFLAGLKALFDEGKLAYLSGYTHRVAISNRRLICADEQNVTFTYKDYADGARPRTMTLGTEEFVRRFCLHVLPERFVILPKAGIGSGVHSSPRTGPTSRGAARLLMNATPVKKGFKKNAPRLACQCGFVPAAGQSAATPVCLAHGGSLRPYCRRALARLDNPSKQGCGAEPAVQAARFYFPQ